MVAFPSGMVNTRKIYPGDKYLVHLSSIRSFLGNNANDLVALVRILYIDDLFRQR